jgi:hypothetical protein
MRIARTSVGMSPEGEPLIPMRSPLGIREGSDPEVSFGVWADTDPLPEYEDHVRGSRLTTPQDCEAYGTAEDLAAEEVPSYHPSHRSFGDPSAVAVRAPPRLGGSQDSYLDPLLIPECDKTDDPPVDSGELPNSDLNNQDSQNETISSAAAQVPGRDDSDEDNTSWGWDILSMPPPVPPTSLQVTPHQDSEFTIYLDFPSQARPRLRCWVYSQMPVREFYHLVASRFLHC